MLNKSREIICSVFMKHLFWVRSCVGHRGCDGEKYQKQPLSSRSWHLPEDRQSNVHIPYDLRCMWGKVGVIWEHIARDLVRSGRAREVSPPRKKMTFTLRPAGGVLRLS